MLKKLLMGTAAVALTAGAAQAQISDNVIKIGVLTDMSSLYTDLAGAGSVVAARWPSRISASRPRQEGRDRLGRPPEQARHRLRHRAPVVRHRQGRRDRRRAELRRRARRQPDHEGQGQGIPASRAPASSDLTGKACSPNTVHWTYDTWMLANGTGSALVQAGGDTWFFITADYAFGHALSATPRRWSRRTGGKVLGSVRYPLNNQDFSLVPAAGAGVEGEDHRACQRRRRHHQLDQAGGGVRHRQGRAEPGRPAGVHHRRPRARAADGAGPDAHRDASTGT